jgi:hypothetical protein
MDVALLVVKGLFMETHIEGRDTPATVWQKWCIVYDPDSGQIVHTHRMTGWRTAT